MSPGPRVLTISVLLAVACSAHQRRIDTARSDGNEPLAMCFETCREDDDGCANTCKAQHPKKWHHAFSPMVKTGKEIAASFAVALHPIAVADARNGGNEPLAACFDTCKPADTSCMHTCDRTHARPVDQERRREMLALVAKVGVEGYKQDQAKRDAWASSNGPSNRPGASSSLSSSGDASAGRSGDSTAQPSQTPPPANPPKNIHFGKSCNECDTNIKHGLNCTISAKATCGEGEMRSGSGFCVARPTDQRGTCSARCSSASDCPSGSSCGNLGTGVSVCIRT